MVHLYSLIFVVLIPAFSLDCPPEGVYWSIERGNDSNNGTMDFPKKTLLGCVSALINRTNTTATICALPGIFESTSFPSLTTPIHWAKIQIIAADSTLPLPLLRNMTFGFGRAGSLEIGHFQVSGYLLITPYDIASLYLHHIYSDSSTIEILGDTETRIVSNYYFEDIHGSGLSVPYIRRIVRMISVSKSELKATQIGDSDIVEITNSTLHSTLYIDSTVVKISNCTATNVTVTNLDSLVELDATAIQMRYNHFAHNRINSSKEPHLIQLNYYSFNLIFESNSLSCNTVKDSSEPLIPLYMGNGDDKFHTISILDNEVDPACPMIICAKGEAPIYGGLACHVCLPNFISEDGTKCVPCPPGTDTSQANNQCTQCSNGKFNPFPNGTCVQCQSSIVNGNSTACLPCPPGTEQSQIDPKCNPCPHGEYNPLPNGKCQTCETGTPNSDSSGCVACPPSSYSVQGICTPCNGTDYLKHKECPTGAPDMTLYIIVGSVAGGVFILSAVIIGVGLYVRRGYTALN